MDTALVLLILSLFWLLGSGSIPSLIRVVGYQGVVLGVLPILAYGLESEVLLVGLSGLVVKGLVFPWLMQRALREARVRREVEPLVSYNLSLLFGVLALGASLVFTAEIPLPSEAPSNLLVPVAFTAVAVGLFLVVARKKALVQALGYLVFENGIYAFGLAVLPHAPLVIEAGILLDALVAVLVMGITLFHINRTFDSLSTERLVQLKD
jgi:hydrogenase-4 component E